MKPQKIVVCPDVHRPYHDKLAWRTFLAATKLLKPDVLVVIGDFADFYPVSFYDKNLQRERFLEKEIADVRVGLDELDTLRVPRKVFMLGNHEHRLERYIAREAPALFGLVTVHELLGLEARGWEWLKYGETLSIGKMDFSHDVGVGGKHAVANSLVAYGDNITIGHTHQLGVSYLGTVRGDKHVGLNVGWLGGLKHIDYKHRSIAARLYQHGFGVVYQDSSGFSSCHAAPIHKGKCEVEGKWVVAK